MKNETFKKYLLLITYTLALAFVLLNLKSILSTIGYIFGLLTPLWIGIALAFVLNVPMSIIEKKLFGKTNKRIRLISLMLSLFIIIMMLLVLFVWVLPDFISSATYLVSQIPNLVNSFNDILVNTFKNTDLSGYLTNFTGDNQLGEIISNLFKGIINNLSGALSNFAGFLVNLFAGAIIAVYLLFGKEKLLANVKGIIKRMFEPQVVKKLDKVFKLSNKSFNNFITYQCLECLILGALIFVTLTIFGFPYAMTIAFLTAVTAIIPIFGATIACVIGAILIGTISIQKAIIFVIIFLVVQQIEGNLIYPRVVGKNVGLPPILTIIALMVGGELAGLLGMVLCIPITSILYSLICTYFDKDDIPMIKIPERK